MLPIISLADTFTAKELREYKLELLRQAAKHNVTFFNCDDSLADVANCENDL